LEMIIFSKLDKSLTNLPINLKTVN